MDTTHAALDIPPTAHSATDARCAIETSPSTIVRMDAHANPGNVVLVVDLGSSRMRCVSVALGDMAASEVASARYPVANARSGALARGFNAALLRTRLLSVLAKAAQDVGPRNVASIAITAQRGATCFFDSDLRTLHAGPNADVRAVFEGAAFDEAFEPLVYGTTGHMPSMMLVPAKLGWWRAHEPRVAQRIASVVGLDAWAALQLTGTLAETPHGQAEAGLLDVSSGEPARDLLSQLAVPLDLLPPTIPLGDAMGRLSREASEATGLPLDVTVHLAGPDAQAAGAGLRRGLSGRRRDMCRLERAGSDNNLIAEIRCRGSNVGDAQRSRGAMDRRGEPRRYGAHGGHDAAAPRRAALVSAVRRSRRSRFGG